MFKRAEISDLPAVVRFCRRHFPHMAGWGRRCAEYIGYYINARLCAINRPSRRVRGVVMGRPVFRVEQCIQDRYSVDWRGDVLWVELVAGDVREALSFAVSCVEEMTGVRLKKIAWNRASRFPAREKPVVFALEKFFERINRFQEIWNLER